MIYQDGVFNGGKKPPTKKQLDEMESKRTFCLNFFTIFIKKSQYQKLFEFKLTVTHIETSFSYNPAITLHSTAYESKR